MEKVEQNTENFYKEINGDCNIEKLKNIANEKIFLYETLLRCFYMEFLCFFAYGNTGMAVNHIITYVGDKCL
ncbi:hypothetical protein U3516DRAFT_749929 [Neocallimastix sp. 'constans']